MMDIRPAEMTPDGFTGAILAVEGILDAAVLLNGPTGCKFYHGALSDGQLIRDSSMDPMQFFEGFYFGQPRVPATYLDDQDYVFGATEKLGEILPKVAEKGHRLIAVVNSPGAALIGDDLERFISEAGLPIPCVAIESTGFSTGFVQGFQEAVIRTLKSLSPPRIPTQAKLVNLIGLSIFHRHWEGNAAEIRRLLSLCGIEVNTVLAAGCSVEELVNMGAAEINLVVHPEFAGELVPFLQERFGSPSLVPASGAPIGFQETENWIKAVCAAVSADPAPALAEIRESRKRAYGVLSRFNSLTGLPRGATFALRADGSISLPLVQWLHDYLGMVPISVSTNETTPGHDQAIRGYLEEIGCGEAWEADATERHPNLVFGGEAFIGPFRARGLPVAGVDIALPASGAIEVLPRCYMGSAGALWLLERILNGLLDAV
jgi:nitrogenase molybdenum-iron protein alpha/beta subunit